MCVCIYLCPAYGKGVPNRIQKGLGAQIPVYRINKKADIEKLTLKYNKKGLIQPIVG